MLYHVLTRRTGRRTGRCCGLERYLPPFSISPFPLSPYLPPFTLVPSQLTQHPGSGVRINCISPGQIDVGVDLKGFDMRGMKSQLPPSNLQSAEVVPLLPVPPYLYPISLQSRLHPQLRRIVGLICVWQTVTSRAHRSRARGHAK